MNSKLKINDKLMRINYSQQTFLTHFRGGKEKHEIYLT